MSKGQPDESTIEAVCNYMLQQNRPYSAVDVWNNLRQEYPKAASFLLSLNDFLWQVVKCLDIGVERKILCEKLISKQKIYFADQSKIKKCNEEELRVMNEAIASKKSRQTDLSNELKALKSELKTYETSLSIEEMYALRERLKTEIKEMELHISNVEESAKTVAINKTKKPDLVAKLESYKKQCKERKRLAESIVETICENTDLSKKKLIDEMGFEME
ncbi:unnamed protein product [Thelazia callipaeda]|uniref:TBPIP domain-containing protein n=1 Tax=Thelazia callipaeda TaxID=103827 RepID=A0A0N5CPD2_THECL|nr:unnamed protein product [Thelazia callipaeda]